MPERPKILLLDDEQDLLDMYKEVLSQLPTHPEIHLANSGARALALLESEPFTLLISDLKMPKMDGLQVMSIVRRKFPDLRVVVMTSMKDEQYRTRAYAMGVDLFWEKPTNAEEIKLFQDCVSAMLGRQAQGGGFRGVQSKSLVDIIQLECLSQNSSVLKVTNGPREGKVWIQEGNIADAATGELKGHAAFKEIFSWRSGAFEILPADPGRPRTIMENYQALLLDTAQSIDEAKGEQAKDPKNSSPLATLARAEGMEFVLEITNGKKSESWGVENADPMTTWAAQFWKGMRQLGDKMKVGEPSQIEGIGLQRHVGLIGKGDKQLCVGIQRSLSASELGEQLQKVKEKWL